MLIERVDFDLKIVSDWIFAPCVEKNIREKEAEDSSKHAEDGEGC